MNEKKFESHETRQSCPNRAKRPVPDLDKIVKDISRDVKSMNRNKDKSTVKIKNRASVEG